MVRYSCLLSAGDPYALPCLKVYSWCIHVERYTPRPPSPPPSCSLLSSFLERRKASLWEILQSLHFCKGLLEVASLDSWVSHRSSEIVHPDHESFLSLNYTKSWYLAEKIFSNSCSSSRMSHTFSTHWVLIQWIIEFFANFHTLKILWNFYWNYIESLNQFVNKWYCCNIVF